MQVLPEDQHDFFLVLFKEALILARHIHASQHDVFLKDDFCRILMVDQAFADYVRLGILHLDTPHVALIGVASFEVLVVEHSIKVEQLRVDDSCIFVLELTIFQCHGQLLLRFCLSTGCSLLLTDVLKIALALLLHIFHLDLILLLTVLLDLAELGAIKVVEASDQFLKVSLKHLQDLLVTLVELKRLVEVVISDSVSLRHVRLFSQQQLQVQDWVHEVLQVHEVWPV